MNLANLRFGLSCLLAAALMTGSVHAQCPGVDDSFEENDLCGTAVTLTAGLHTGLYAEVGDDDYYRITVPANEMVIVEQLSNPANGEMGVHLFDDPVCTNFVSSQNWNAVNTVSFGNSTGATADFYLLAYAANTNNPCNNYDLNVTIVPDPCLQGFDDAFEDNDSCAAAITLPTGATTGLFCSVSDEDYFRIDVPPGDQVIVSQTYVSANAEMQLDLYSDAACTSLVDSVGWGVGLNEVVGGNGTGAVATFYIKSTIVDGVCNDYDLNITIQPDPCLQPGVDDIYEDNEDCASAVSLTSGAYTGLFVAAADEDFFEFTVADGELFTIDQSWTWVQGSTEIAMELFIDGTCTSIETAGNWGGGVNSMTWANATGASVDCVVRCMVIDGDCSSYDLTVGIGPDPCQTAIDDSYEPNDTCGSGSVMVAGTHTGLFTSLLAPDYYEVAVNPAELITVDMAWAFSGTQINLDMYSDPACTNWIAGQTWGNGNATDSWANETGAVATVYVACTIVPGGPEACQSYDLTVSFAPDPCQQPGVDDIFEDNDDCGSATLIAGAGASWTNLFVSKTDKDFFTFTLPDGGSVNIDCLHTQANGDLDIYLYDEHALLSGWCGGTAFGEYLDRGFTSSDDENISWDNTTGATVTYYLMVEAWDNSSNASCNNYDLDVTLVGGVTAEAFCFGDGTADAGSGPVGCPCGNNTAPGAGEGCMNSQGHGAILTSNGSNSYAADDLSFTISQARPSQPSMLVQGTSRTALPFKDGILCMGNPTERVEVVFTDANGEGTTSSSIVTNGNVPGPGVTRYYQQWYRDPNLSVCGTGSSFSQGLKVIWQ